MYWQKWGSMMNKNNPYQQDHDLTVSHRSVVLAYMAVVGLVLLLMMVAGLLLRMGQGQWLEIRADLFYQILTLHGTGMVGISAIAGAGVMWYFLRQYVVLSPAVAWLNLGLFLAGVVLIIISIFLGGYAGMWTFLYPLPAQSVGVWGQAASTGYLTGLLLVGVGFLLLHLDAGRAIIQRYGSLAKGLGWPKLFGRDQEAAPPPAVIASSMVTIVNLLGLVSGAAILVMSLVNLHIPAFTIDPLLAKNMIYFFGHIFINATIYMSVIGVYHLLPRYTGRAWSSNDRVFLAAWTITTVMVVIVYPHHLLMDFAQPVWLHVTGQIISYTSGLPVLAVTAYGAIVNVYRSGIRWDLASGLLFLGTFGWAVGIIPAMIDATISVNLIMHNTLWVPGHFHFYLLLGMFAMVLGFMSWMIRTYARIPEGRVSRLAFWVYVFGGIGFVGMFLLSGRDSIPRRYAVHFDSWLPYGQIASLFAMLVVLATAVFVIRFLTGLARAAKSGEA